MPPEMTPSEAETLVRIVEKCVKAMSAKLLLTWKRQVIYSLAAERKY